MNAFAPRWSLPKLSGLELRLVTLVVVGMTPVIWALFNDDWSRPESGHGPIILSLSLFLFAKAWREGGEPREDAGALSTFLWVSMLSVAVISYVFGTIGEIVQLSYGSLIPLLAAIVFAFQPRARWRHFVFTVLFLLFSVPLPGFIVDPITLPFKLLVSHIAEGVLQLAGYPIARSGVVLYIGPYQLLVADACAGLRTLFTLEALGLFYLNVVQHSSTLRNVGLAILIIPISIIANSLRVIILCLITYTYGDEVGQGFLHEFAGLVLFMLGLVMLLAVDAGLRTLAVGVARRKAIA